MAVGSAVRDLNLFDIPLFALRCPSRIYLASLLNCPKVLPSPNGLPRDWRGLAHLSGVPTGGGRDNPTLHILTAWEKDASATLGQLQEYFGEMDRWDVHDDMKEILCEDAEEYLRRMNNDGDTKNDVSLKDGETDRHVLTVDDVCRLERGGSLQYYDAFLLYADEDVDFAMEMVEKLENGYNLKLCYKDRDLIGGLTFEHEAIMRLIAERCQRLVIIVTSSFLNSPANKFFVTFAQALGIEQRQRKVIPCIYERCILPVELSYYFPLDYNRASKLWNFWDKLRDSISVPNMTSVPPSRATVREVHSAEYSNFKKLEAPPSPSSLKLTNTRKFKSLEAPPSPSSAQLSSTSKFKSLDTPSSPSSAQFTNNFNSLNTPPSPRSCGSTNTVQIEEDSLNKLSDLNVSDKKGKSKRFFDKIFSSKDSGWKKGSKKKTAVLEQ